MQPIPTLSSPIQLNDAHTKMLAQSSVMFRPYNHFPITNTSTFNTLNAHEPRVSAFKVVGKRPRNSDISSEIPLKLSKSETNHYCSLDLSKLITPINRKYFDDSKLLSMANLYNSTISSGELNGSCPLNLKKNNTQNHETVTPSTCDMAYDLTTTHQHQPKIHNTYQTDVNLNKPVIQYRYTAQDSPNGKVYQWESLLPIVSESMKKPEITVPLKKFHTQNQRHDEIAKQQLEHSIKETQVPVIDLTINEDGDCESELNGKRSRSLIELNVTPPLDINGNEILITTDTKTMQAISYKKKKPKDSHESKPKIATEPMCSMVSPIASDLCTPQILCSMFQQSNRIQNGFRMPPKEQIKFDNKYNRWLRYLRSYNGFRLFAQRYYRKAQAYSQAHTQLRLQTQNSSKTRLFIESVLLKWWNSLNANEKEQYVQIAELRKCQTMEHETQAKH